MNQKCTQITNTTITKCQHCGELTNYASDPHHQVRERGLTRFTDLQFKLPGYAFGGEEFVPGVEEAFVWVECLAGKRVEKIKGSRQRNSVWEFWAGMSCLWVHGPAFRSHNDAMRWIIPTWGHKGNSNGSWCAM